MGSITPTAAEGSHLPSIANGLENGGVKFAEYPSTEPEGKYEIPKHWHSEPSRIRVAGVGAGASGLCLAYKMEKMLDPGTWDLVLYEKNPQLGGTWYENTYPGIACDTPSHLYTYTFWPKTDWSHFFAYGPEILKYFEAFADKFNTHQYIKLDTKLVEARWDEEKGIYNFTLEDQKTKETWHDWAHVLINGTGILNTWKWPEIEGLHDFKGELMHSARWNQETQFEGKTVGLIGTGSTSVQIVPQIQPKVRKLEVYMRSPTWISPPFGAGVLEQYFKKGAEDDAGQRQYTFTEEDKRRFVEDPEFHLIFRKKIEAEVNGMFPMYQKGSELSEAVRTQITGEMHRRMGEGNEELKSFIIPKWAPGCRRISPGDGYLEALVQPNTTPVYDAIEKVVPEGLLTADGKVHELDILVCATGYAVAFKPAFKVVNADGKTVHEDWGSSVNLYMGVSAPRFPNYYTIVGPGATWSNGTLIPSIETTIEYSIKMIKLIQTEGVRSIDVKQDALDDLYAHIDKFHETTVFGEDCTSWFKNGTKDGRVYLWPGSTIHFLKSIKEPRLQDYNIRYRSKNRFAFLGNGDVKYTWSNNIDKLSSYVRNEDTEWSVE